MNSDTDSKAAKEVRTLTNLIAFLVLVGALLWYILESRSI